MKNLILIAILFNASIFADYSNHKDSKEVIDELVNEYGFEESYVINVLKQAKKEKQHLIQLQDLLKRQKLGMIIERFF